MDVKELKPGKELDALVAEKVMGWKIGFDPAEDGGASWFTESNGGDWVETEWYPDNFKPSTDISAAWGIVEKMKGLGAWIEVAWNPIKKGYRCMIGAKLTKDLKSVDVNGLKTAPHAICLAALLAMEDKA